MPLSSGPRNKQRNETGSSRRQGGFACYLLHADSFLGLLLDPENGSDMSFPNVS
jgi:hypothetical protein